MFEYIFNQNIAKNITQLKTLAPLLQLQYSRNCNVSLYKHKVLSACGQTPQYCRSSVWQKKQWYSTNCGFLSHIQLRKTYKSVLEKEWR